MTTIGRYQITYVGNGILRLPRAGIFQTGTRAVVDETIARIAVAHGSFQVVPLTADAPVLQAPAAVAAAPPPPPAPAPTEKPRGRQTRQSAAIRVPAVDAAHGPNHR
jgi:hypothetical protein